MAEHGGYRKPTNPAPVSGPGAHSKRTDGKPGEPAHQSISAAPDQAYGDMTAQQNAQRTAPMAGATPLPPAAPVPSGQGGGAAQAPAYSGGGFADPSTRPDEPVTHGADAGPGAGPEAMSFQSPQAMGATTGAMTQLLTQFAPTDASGVVASLLSRAQSLGV
jgi:hypothetical protein